MRLSLFYKLTFGCLAACLLTAGCGGKEEPVKAAPPAMQAIPTPVTEGLTPPPDEPMPAPAPPGAKNSTNAMVIRVRAAESQEEIDELLAGLNELLLEQVKKTGKFPASTEEFVRIQRMGSLPPVTPGKQVVLDPQRRAFVLAAKK